MARLKYQLGFLSVVSIRLAVENKNRTFTRSWRLLDISMIKLMKSLETTDHTRASTFGFCFCCSFTIASYTQMLQFASVGGEVE